MHSLTRYGLEEYIADCVISLDNRVVDQLATRRLRILKYRGSRHGADEYPFLIGTDGITIFPITSLKTDYKLSRERVSTGITRLDAMFSGKGYFRGSAILVSGTAGTGKSSIAAYLHRCGMQARRKMPLLCIRRNTGPDHTQYGLDRP